MTGARRLPLAVHFLRAFELCPNESLAHSGFRRGVIATPEAALGDTYSLTISGTARSASCFTAASRHGIAHASAPNASTAGKHSITYRGSTVCNCVITTVRIATNKIKNPPAVPPRHRHNPHSAKPAYTIPRIPNPSVTPKSARFSRHFSPGGHKSPEYGSNSTRGVNHIAKILCAGTDTYVPQGRRSVRSRARMAN